MLHYRPRSPVVHPGRAVAVLAPGAPARFTGAMRFTPLPRAKVTLGHPQPGLKHVRAAVDGVFVVDMRPPLMVWEHSRYPWYFTSVDRIAGELVPAGEGTRSRSLGPCEEFDLVVGSGRVLPRAIRRYPQAKNELVRDSYTFDWEAFDTWFEENEIVTVHARDPYVRVDTLASSRHVEVVFAGVVVAESRRPVVLLETGLPPRFYLPRVDVRMDLLRPTDTVSHCPYKGTARYWTVTVGSRELPDGVWSYERPLPEVQKIAGLVAFWPEQAPGLTISVDGEPLT